MQKHEVFQMVFSSSCSVYGDAEFFPITESHPTGKVTCTYGRTKYFSEEIMKDLSRTESVSLLKKQKMPLVRYYYYHIASVLVC